MKISLNWIKEFTDIKLTVDELVVKIGAQLGEVEEVINLGEKYEGILVAKVVSCEKHPNADKLKVCTIDDGNKIKNVKRDKDGFVQVVCGAPNVRKGITVAWIPPGVIVPSSFDTEKFKLEARELRGVISNGMLASGKELAINDDHEGILVIDKPCEPGAKFSEIYELDDFIIDIENKMFTHRPDCFGQLGVAREIAGISGIKFTSPNWYLSALETLTGGNKNQLKLEVKNFLPELVPRFMAVAISNVKVQKSPIIIQSFLSRVGIKPINNLVDITNFVMSLTAQPLHAYDYDKIAKLDDSKYATIIVRKPKSSENILLLNGKTITPNPKTIMIASAKSLIAVGGVMGGTDTEVDMQTKNIVLECATFDMYSVRRTSMEFGLFTDGVTRFSKGQSFLQNDKVLAYAVAWVGKLAGGEVASKVWDEKNIKPEPKPIKISVNFINSRLGTSLSTKEVLKILTNVEFLVDAKDDDLLVTAPYWRTDIEISEDIVEEVGRLYGYDKLPIELPKRLTAPSSVNKMIRTKAKVRSVLVGSGANEVLTYSFVHNKLFDSVGQDSKLAFRLSNALSPELQYYRLSLLPSLLEKVHLNIKAGYNEFAIFEINKTHDKSNTHEDGLPVEEEKLALVFVADKKATSKYNGSPYYQAKVYIENLLSNFGLTDVIYEPVTSHKPKTETGKQVITPFESSRSAYVKTLDGKLLGILGEVKPEVKKNLKLPSFISGFELDLKMLETYQKSHLYEPLRQFPISQQDITLSLKKTVSYSEVLQVIKEVLADYAINEEYRYKIKLKDIYQKSDIEKNMTFRIILSNPNRTLITDEVSRVISSISKSASIQLGARIV